MSSHPLLKEAVSRIMRARADEDGIIRNLPRHTIADIARAHTSSVNEAIRDLIADGRMVCLQEARGSRGTVWRMIKERPVSSIESVIRFVTTHSMCSSTTHVVPISLPRLKCLERPPCS